MTKKDFRMYNSLASGKNILDDPFLFMDKDEDDEAMEKGDYLVYSAGLTSGGLNSYMPFLLDDDTLTTSELEVPLLTTAMAAGGRPSLSQHLLPALAATGEDIS